MTYPKYTVPPIGGTTLSMGAAPASPVQPDDQRFCTYEDAKIILKVFTDAGVPDASLVDASMATINGEHFNNVPANAPARPWYITSAQVTGPVGPALWLQLGPNSINGGGRGNPGKWTGILTGNPRYIPDPIQGTMPVATPSVPNTNDASAFYSAQGGNNMAADLAEVKRLVTLMAASINIK